LTSNIGGELIDRLAHIGFGRSIESDAAQYEEVKDKVMTALKDHFRPEFLNRLDEIIIFDVLAKEALAQIVEKEVETVVARLAAKRIALTLLPEVRAYLAEKGFSPQYGARPLRRVVQDKILTPVASMMVLQGVLEGGSVNVSMKGGEPHFEVKNVHVAGSAHQAQVDEVGLYVLEPQEPQEGGAQDRGHEV
jgi:ATP-dependent Clp protease ATP-binding subunit ClpA